MNKSDWTEDGTAMNATGKAHGMDGSLVYADWAPLAMKEVRVLLRQFPQCHEPIAFLGVSPRPFSSAAVVSTEGEPVFIKRHHRSVRDQEALLEEHRFLQYLHQQGAPVPLVHSTDTGQTAIESGEWTYEVHEVPAGLDPYRDAPSWTPFQSAAHAHSAGRAMARLHCAAQSFSAPPRKPRPLVASFTIFAAHDPGDELAHYLAARPALAHHAAVHECAQEALSLLAPFHAELQPLLPALAQLWTHNDLHASNLLWSNTGPNAHATAIIDFGLADRTVAIHDLAHAIERNIVEWLVLAQHPKHAESVPVHLDHLCALLDGYESVRPLIDKEAFALAPMTALCHAEFALSEADYFLGVLRSEEKAILAYDGWLVGHASWLRSAAGEKLLHGLRDWAAKRDPLRRRS